MVNQALALVALIGGISRTPRAVRRNRAVSGRMRHVSEHPGGFFGRYFLAMERQELPL